VKRENQRKLGVLAFTFYALRRPSSIVGSEATIKLHRQRACTSGRMIRI
jgi:hypothetical protein